MNRSLFLLLVLLLTGCASFQVSTLNYDPIYSIEGSDVNINIVNNEFQLRNLLRTDFNFRYDFAQYALRQPISFDWNNRVLGNRFSYYNPYYSRTQMWNDWVWGYNWNSPHNWSPFGYDRWGYNNYGWNNYGWNYNNRWNNWNYGYYNANYNRRTNTSYINSIRGRVSQTRKSNSRIINTRTNDQIIRNNTGTRRSTQSSDNGRGGRSREILPTQPVRVRQPSTVQPRQIRRRSKPPVPQQTRPSVNASSKRRSSGGR